MKARAFAKKSVLIFVLVSFSLVSVLTPPLAGPPPAFAKEEEPEDPSSVPVILLSDSNKANQVLKTANLEVRLDNNCPMGLAFAMIFLEFAKRGMGEEDVLKFAKEAKVNPSNFGTLLALANEGQVNACVLLADGTAQNPESLEREFSGEGFRAAVFRNSQFNEDSLYLLAFAALIYRVPLVKIGKILRAAGVEPESFSSQVGITQRFLQAVYTIPLPKSMGFRQMDQLAPMEEKASEGTDSGLPETPADEVPAPKQSEPLSEEPAAISRESSKEPESADVPQEMPEEMTKERSERVLDQARKDLEKVNERLLSLNRTDPVELEKALEYLDTKVQKISRKLARIAEGEAGPAIELHRQRILEMLTGLENKKSELAEELGRVKAERGIEEILGKQKQKPQPQISLEEIEDRKEELLAKVRSVDRKDLGAVEALVNELDAEILRLEKISGGADVPSESILRAVMAELTAEMRRLTGVKNALLSEKMQEPVKPAAPAVPETKAVEEKGGPIRPFGITLPFVFSKKEDERKKERERADRLLELQRRSTKIADAMDEEIQKRSAKLLEQARTVPRSDPGRTQALTEELDQAVQEFRQKITGIPPQPEAGDYADRKRNELLKLTDEIERQSADLKKESDDLGRRRNEEYAAAERAVQQANMVFESLSDGMEKVPEDLAVIDAKIEELSALDREFARKAEALQSSTGDARVEGLRERLKSISSELENRTEEFRELRQTVSQRAAREKAAKEEAEESAREKAEQEKVVKEIAENERGPETLTQMLVSKLFRRKSGEPKETVPVSGKKEKPGIEIPLPKTSEKPGEVLPVVEKRKEAAQPAVEKPRKAVPEREFPGRKSVPEVRSSTVEEEEAAKRLYEKISAELQRLEAILPNIRLKGSSELEATLSELREKKGEFVAEYNTISNTTGAASIIRLEESLADMLEEIGSFEVQVAERLRVMNLREKRSRDQDSAVLEGLAAGEKSFAEEIGRLDPGQLDPYLKKLDEFSAEARNRYEGMNTPDLKEKAEGVLKRLAGFSENARAKKDEWLKEGEVREARAFVSAAKESEDDFHQRLSALSRTDPKAMEAMIGELDLAAGGLKAKTEKMKDSFNSDEVGSAKKTVLAVAEGLASEAGKLGAEIAKLKLLEEEEDDKARKYAESAQAKYRDLWRELDSVADDENGFALKRQKWGALKAEFTRDAGAILNTTASARVEAAKNEVLKLAEQAAGLAAKAGDNRERMIRAKEEALARTLYEEAEKELGVFEPELARLEGMPFRDIEALLADVKARRAEFESRFRSLSNTTEASGIAFLQSKTRKLLETLSESETTITQSLEAAYVREEKARQEEAEAQAYQARFSDELTRLQTAKADRADGPSDGISALLEEVKRSKEKFRMGFQELPDTAGSSAVRSIKDRIASLLDRWEMLEAELGEMLRIAGEREERRKEEEAAARSLRDRVREKLAGVSRELPGLGEKSSADVEAALKALEQEVRALETDFGAMKNSTGSGEIARCEEEVQNLLTDLGDCMIRTEEILGSVVQLESRRAREEKTVREFHARVMQEAGRIEEALAGLAGKEPPEIEDFGRKLAGGIEAMEGEYQAVENSTGSKEIKKDLSAVAAAIERLKDAEQDVKELLAGAREREKVRIENEKAAKDLAARVRQELVEAERAGNVLGDKTPAEIREFLGGLSPKISALRKSYQELEGVADSPLLNEISREAGALLEELDGAFAEMAEKLRLMEMREARRAEEEGAAEALLKRLEKRIRELESEAANLADQGAVRIEEILGRVRGESAGFEEEFSELKNTVRSEKMESSRAEILASLNGLKDFETQVEEVLKEVRGFETRRSEEERLAGALQRQVGQALDGVKEGLGMLENREVPEIESLLADLDSQISGFESRYKGLKNTTGSEEVARLGEEIGRSLDEFRRAREGAESVLQGVREFEEKRASEEEAAENMRDRFAKALSIVDQEVSGFGQKGPEEIGISLDALAEKIAGYENEFRALANSTGSEAVGRFAGEIAKILDEFRSVEKDGREFWDAACELEERRRAEERVAEELGVKVSRFAEDLGTEMPGLGERSSAEIETYLSGLEAALKSSEGEALALKNTTGSEAVIRAMRDIEAALGGMKMKLADVEGVLKNVREYEKDRAEEEAAARDLLQRIKKEAGAMEQELGRLDERSSAEIERLLGDLKESLSGFERESGALNNATGSTEVFLLKEEMQRLLQQMKRGEAEAAEILKNTRDYERAREEEIAAAQDLHERMTGSLEGLRRELPGLSAKTPSEVESFLAVLDGEIAELEGMYGALKNTTGSKEVFRRTGEMKAMLEEFGLAAKEVGENLLLVREQESKRMAEEEAALNMKDRFQKALSIVADETAGLGERDSEEIGIFLRGLEEKISGYETEYQGLSNSAGSEKTERLAGEIGRILGELKSVEKEAGDVFEAAREFEARRKNEEKTALDQKDRLERSLAEARGAITAMTKKSSPEIEDFLAGLTADLEAYVKEFGDLMNTAGSDEVVRVSGEIQRGLEEFRGLEQEAEEVLAGVRAFETARDRETKAAEGLKARLTEALGMTEKDLALIHEKNTDELEAYSADFQGRIEAFGNEYRELKNSTGSDEVARRAGEISALLDELAGVGNDIANVLEGARETEARRTGEEKAARESKEKIARELSAMKAGLAGLDGKSSAEIEEVLRDWNEQVAACDRACKELKNTSGSREVALLIEENGRSFEELVLALSGADEVLARAKALEARQEEEVRAVRALKLEIEEDLPGIENERSLLKQKSPAEIEDLLVLFGEKAEFYDAAYRRLKNTAGLQEIETTGRDIVGLLSEIESIRKEFELALKEAREAEARRGAEEYAARALLDSASKALGTAGGEISRMKEKGAEEIGACLEDLRRKISGLETAYGELGNKTGSALVASLSAEIAGILDEFSAVEKEAAEILEEAKKREMLRKEEELAATGLTERIGKALSGVKADTGLLSEKSPGEIEAYLESFRSGIAGYERELLALANTTGLDAVARKIGEAHEMLESLKAEEGEIGEVYEKAKELEANRAAEEAAARELKSKLEIAAAAVNGELSALEQKNAREIGIYLESLKEKIRGFDRGYGVLTNSAGSEETGRLTAACKRLMEEFRRVEKEVELLFEDARSLEARRAAEENAARELKERVLAIFAEVDREGTALKQMPSVELEKYLEDLNKKVGDAERALREMKNTVSSAAVSGLRNEIAELLGQWGQKEKEIRKIADERETKARILKDRIEEAASDYLAGMAGLSGMDLAEAQVFFERLSTDRKGLLEELDAMRGSGLSPDAARLVDQAGAFLGELEKMEEQAGGVLEEMKKTELLRREEESAARELKGRMVKSAEILKKDLSAFGDENAAGLDDFIANLRGKIESYEAEAGGLADTTGSAEVSRIKTAIGSILRDLKSMETGAEALLVKAKETAERRRRKEESVRDFRKKMTREINSLKAELSGLNEKPAAEIEAYISRLKMRVSGFRSEYEKLEIPEDSDEMLREDGEILRLLSDSKEVEKAAEERFAKIQELEGLRTVEETAARDLRKRAGARLEKLKEELGTMGQQSTVAVDSFLKVLKEEIRSFSAEAETVKNTTRSVEVAQIVQDVQRLLAELRANEKEAERVFSDMFKFENTRKEEEQAAKELKIVLLRKIERVKQEILGLSSKDSAEIAAYLETLREEENDYEEQYRALANTSGSSEVVRLSGEIARFLDEIKKLEEEIGEVLGGVRDFEDIRRNEEEAVQELKRKISLDLTEMSATTEGLALENPDRVEGIMSRLREKIGSGRELLGKIQNTTRSEKVVRDSKETERILAQMDEIAKKTEDMMSAAKELEKRRRSEIEAKEAAKAEEYLAACQEKYQAAVKSAGALGDDELAIEVKVQELEKLKREIERGAKEIANTTGSSAVEEARASAVKLRDRLSEEVRGLHERRGRLIRLREEEIAKELYEIAEEELARIESILAELASWPSGNLESYLRELRKRRLQFEERANRLENTSGSTLVDFTRTNLAKIFAQIEGREREIQQTLAGAQERETRRLEEESLARSLHKALKKTLEDADAFVSGMQEKNVREVEEALKALNENVAGYRTKRGALQNTTGANEVDRLAQEMDGFLARLDGDSAQIGKVFERELAAGRRKEAEETAANALSAEVKKEVEMLDAGRTVSLAEKPVAEIRGMVESLAQRISAIEANLSGLENSSGSEAVVRSKEEIKGSLGLLKERKEEMSYFLVRAGEYEEKRLKEIGAAKDLHQRFQSDFEKMTIEFRGLEKKSSVEIEKFVELLEQKTIAYRNENLGLRNETASGEVVELGKNIEILLSGMKSLAAQAGNVLSGVRKKEEAQRAGEAEAWTLYNRIKQETETVRNEMKNLPDKSAADAKVFIEDLKGKISRDGAELEKMKKSVRAEEVQRLGQEIETLLNEIRAAAVHAEEILKKIRETEGFKQADEQAAVSLFQRMDDDLSEMENRLEQVKTGKPGDAKKILKELNDKKEEYLKASENLRNRGDFSSVTFVQEELRGKLGEWDRLRQSAEDVRNAKTGLKKNGPREDGEIQKLYERVQQEVTSAEISLSNLKEMKPEDLHAMILEFRLRRKELFDTYWELANGKSMSQQSPLLQKVALMMQKMDDYERRFWQVLKDKRAGSGGFSSGELETLREIENFKKELEKKMSAGKGGSEKISQVIQDMESFLAKHEKRKDGEIGKIVPPEAESVSKPDLEKSSQPEDPESLAQGMPSNKQKMVEAR